MTHDDIELRLGQNLREQAPEPSWDFRNRVMAEVADLPQRHGRVARWWPEPYRLPDGMAAIIAVLLLTGLIIGAIAFGSGVVRLPSVLPPDVAPSPSATADASATANPTPEPTVGPPPGLVVYQRHTRIANGQEGACGTPSAPGCTQWSTIFVANDDGTQPRELTPGAWDAEPVALSPDGTQLIVRVMGFEVREDHYYLSDLSGSGLELLDTGCRAPCIGDSGFGFSPDGERLAFIRSFGTAEPPMVTESVLAIMDLVTLEVVELDSTRVQDTAAVTPCPEGCELGHNESPRWSPDGAHLLFTRSGMRSPFDPNAFIGMVTFIVDDDGGNLRELVPLELFARDAHWSPDGARIVFTSAIEGSTEDRAFYQLNDIYSVRPDGTQLTRLTRYSEGPIEAYAAIGALRPSWTRDGRIVFVVIPRGEPDTPQAWIIDADGNNAQALVPADVSTFTRIGCVTCPYPPDELAGGGYNLAGAANAIWLARP